MTTFELIEVVSESVTP